MAAAQVLDIWGLQPLLPPHLLLLGGAMDLNALRHLQNAGMQQYLLLQHQNQQQLSAEDGQQQLLLHHARAAGFAPVQLLSGGQAQSVCCPPLHVVGTVSHCTLICALDLTVLHDSTAPLFLYVC